MSFSSLMIDSDEEEKEVPKKTQLAYAHLHLEFPGDWCADSTLLDADVCRCWRRYLEEAPVGKTNARKRRRRCF